MEHPRRSRLTLPLTLFALLCACDEKKDAPGDGKPEAATKAEAKPAAAKAGKTEPAAKAEPKLESPPPPPANVDPASFVAVDLASVAALAKYTVNGPPGATVTADRPPLGETAPTGAVVGQDGFKLHLWHGTIGGERAGVPMRAKAFGSTYAETKLEGDKGLLEYSLTKNGKTTLGYIQSKFSTLKGSLLCGTAEPVADAAALEPYRKACESLAEKGK
jgi:hypothetical protein